MASRGTTPYKYDSNGTVLITIIVPLLARNVRPPRYDLPSKVNISPVVGFNVITESRDFPLTAILLPRTPTDTTL